MSHKHFRCPSCGALNRVAPDRAGPTCGRCDTAINTSGQPIHLDDDTLEQLMRNSRVPVLIDFYADWCAPCRAIAPSLERLGAEHAGDLLVVKIDTEQSQRIAQRLGVQGIPALFLVKGDKVLDKAIGMQPYANLARLVAPHV